MRYNIQVIDKEGKCLINQTTDKFSDVTDIIVASRQDTINQRVVIIKAVN